MPRKRFDRAYIERELEKIGKHLAAPLPLYFIGGCAMSMRNLKEATFDVDVIVESAGDFERFSRALGAAGFNRTSWVLDEHAELFARDQFENADGLHVDIFVEQVCKMLKASPAMKKRAGLYKAFGNLRAYLMSAEDIFIFKGFAGRGRPRDFADMALLMPKGLDWRVIEEESLAQAGKNAQWLSYFLHSLVELEEKQGIQTPIYNRLLKKYERLCEEENKTAPAFH